MTLTTHAVFGAAAAIAIAPRNPFLAFIVAFGSHFLLDAFPHGHYPLKSHTHHPENHLEEDMVLGMDFFTDLIKIGFDFALGFGLSYALFGTHDAARNWIMLLGAFAGMLPDGLQFLYFKIRAEPFTSMQKFHIAVHAEKKYDRDMTKGILVELTAIFAGYLLWRLLGA